MNRKSTNGNKPSLAAWAMVLSFTALGAAHAMSGEADSGKPCNAKMLRGDYGIQMQGTRMTPPPNPVLESVVGVVLRSFDGYGEFTQVDNIKGSVSGIVPDRPGAGTYEVFPDCSGATYFQPDPNNPGLVIKETFVILDNGNELRSVAESPASLMVSSVAKRVHKR